MSDITAPPTTASTAIGGIKLPGLGDIGAFFKRGDLALAIGVLTIRVVLILPLPPLLLDLALAISIIISVLILMTALFIHTPLEFSSFPTVLLIATMLRLGGHPAPRSPLDAMRGKQMAIDADLSAGLIDEKEARRRRQTLEDEGGFFGAMDGASKFVRGDAIAGLLVVFINVIGGMIIGIAQQGLSFAEAARSYTILTVGDGLVTQVPALIVSTAAGLLVSKAGIAGAADKALFEQMSTYPKALGMSGGG